MEKTIKELGGIIDAYDGGDAEGIHRYNKSFDRALNCEYPILEDPERREFDHMRHIFFLSVCELGTNISDSDRINARYKYDVMVDALENVSRPTL